MYKVNKVRSVSLIFLLSAIVLAGCKKNEPEPEPKFAPYGVVKGFVIDMSDNKIIATDSGLFKLDVSNSAYVKMDLDPMFADISDLKTFSYDQSGDIYLGSNVGALNYSSGVHYQNSNSGLVSDKVLSIGLDLSMALFFGTPKGISIMNNNDWLLHTGRDDFYLQYTITDTGTTSKGHTYVATNGGGVGRFQLDIDGISGSTIMDTDWTKIPSNTVNTVFIYDTIQVYGTDKGVGIHYSEFTKWDWEAYDMEDGLVANNVLAVNRDAAGNYWFGTDAGLSMFDGSVWASFTKQESNLIDDVIKFIASDSDGNIWVATDSGIGTFQNQQWINYPKEK